MTKAQRSIATRIAKVFHTRCRPYGYRSPMTASKLAQNGKFKFAGEVKVSYGVYRVAFITNDTVYKMARMRHNDNDLKSETAFIKEMTTRGYGQHFPKTEIVKTPHGHILVQERINMSHRSRLREALFDYVVDLGRSLGVDDIHSANFGWRGRGKKLVPVFVDVDLRISDPDVFTARPAVVTDPKIPQMSWMVEPLFRPEYDVYYGSRYAY